jgi:3'-phosphoadenosine 5'-phosphosulfate sulfotransferase (PAPS reductase)/FAD synthetase
MTKEMDEVRGLAQEHGTDLSVVVNHSGGKDSARMLGLVRKKFPDTPLML